MANHKGKMQHTGDKGSADKASFYGKRADAKRESARAQRAANKTEIMEQVATCKGFTFREVKASDVDTPKKLVELFCEACSGKATFFITQDELGKAQLDAAFIDKMLIV